MISKDTPDTPEKQSVKWGKKNTLRIAIVVILILLGINIFSGLLKGEGGKIHPVQNLFPSKPL